MSLDTSEALSCVICLSLFQNPVTLPCGHSFCRTCLREALSRKSSCPTCRCLCSPTAFRSGSNLSLMKCIQVLFPEHTFKAIESPTNRSTNFWSGPLFELPFDLFPGQLCHLRVFEPRYLYLVDRILSCDRKFVIHRNGKESSVGSLVEIHGEIDERFYNGSTRVIFLITKCISRIQFNTDADFLSDIDRQVGLRSCDVNKFEDHDLIVPLNELSEGSKKKLVAVHHFMSLLYQQLSQRDILTLDVSGEFPKDYQKWQNFVFWVCTACRLNEADKEHCFLLQSCEDRLLRIFSVFSDKLRNFPNPECGLLLSRSDCPQLLVTSNIQHNVFNSNETKVSIQYSSCIVTDDNFLPISDEYRYKFLLLQSKTLRQLCFVIMDIERRPDWFGGVSFRIVLSLVAFFLAVFGYLMSNERN